MEFPPEAYRRNVGISLLNSSEKCEDFKIASRRELREETEVNSVGNGILEEPESASNAAIIGEKNTKVKPRSRLVT